MTDISIIIPTLNEEDKLKKCLLSVRNQKTDIDFEVIISDGNSNDRTREIAEKYADKILTVTKKGIWRARNQGAKSAKSEYLCFIDADTLLPRNYISSVYPIISNDNSIAALSCAFTFDKTSRTLKAVESICNNYLAIKGISGKGEILGFNNVIRKSFFSKLGGFPNRPLEDGALSIRMRRLGRVIFLNEPRVTTSARRFENGGVIKTTFYYAGLSLATNIPHETIKKIFSYKKV